MTQEFEFGGFSRETVAFFKGLSENNNKDWFDERRHVFESQVMEPAKAFVTAMGGRLRTVVPRIVAVAKVNKSIFRINRDARFTLDMHPYKTNLGIYFWEDCLSRMESSGFYFHLEPPKLILGVGMYVIPDRLLERYRRAVVDKKLGGELAKIVSSFRAKKDWELGGKHYKRVPAGYDASHPNAPFLLHKGLWAGHEAAIPKEFFSSRLVDYCYERYEPFVPLHRWLVKVAR